MATMVMAVQVYMNAIADSRMDTGRTEAATAQQQDSTQQQYREAPHWSTPQIHIEAKKQNFCLRPSEAESSL